MALGAGKLLFAERLAPDGTLTGEAGPPDDPGRWRWTGTWTIDGNGLCRVVPAVNTVACLALEMDRGSVSIRRITGKLGGGAAPTKATLVPDGVPLPGWTASTAVSFAFGGGT